MAKRSGMRLVFARTLLGVLGGYALASAMTVFVAAVLPLPRAQAVLAATLASFAIIIAMSIAAFAVADLRRLLIGWSVATLLFGGAGLMMTRAGL